MILELRILSGLHRGATLPLDDHALVLGSDEDADVVLTDTGCTEQHASLLRTEDGWTLSALNGSICAENEEGPQAVIDLAPGELARMGDVWLTVVEQDAPWRNPPAFSAEPLFDAAAPENGLDAADDAEEAVLSQADRLPAAASAVPDTARAGARGLRGLRRLISLPFGVAAVMSAAAAYAITASSGSSGTISGGRQAQPWGTPAEMHQAQSEAWTMDELRLIFRKRMSDADLLRRFDLDLGDHAWNMQASLDSEETARFERILAGFMVKHNVTFPVNARIGSPESLLPFRVTQIVTGADASIVTSDGRRIYVGDTYKGVQLVAVRGNTLVFDGKRKIEVVW